MKLTKYLKDEISQRIINSLPKGVDYETLMQEAMWDDSYKQLPIELKEAIEKNKDVKNYLNVARKRVPSCDCLMLSSFSFYEITKETEKIIFDLHVLHDEQREKLRDLRNKIRAIVNSSRTVEQFCKDYPEFAKYAKQEDEQAKNLPATNLIAEMKKIGWESK